MNNDKNNNKEKTKKKDLAGLQQIAVNPNPRANANIKDIIEDESKAQIDKAKNSINNEITDGEGG